jgi:methionine sulfoxide reductase heme-binding subunit
MLPWLDRKGRLAPLKLVVFVALFVPGLWTAADYALGNLGARPLTEVIHSAGLWMIRFLFLSLLITPARELLRWPRLILIRRMVGVAAFAYGAAHIGVYVADQMFDLAKVASEIVLRIYLTIGFVALLMLAALAATSTDGMIRRLGSDRWRRLHRLSYGIGILGLIHFFIQSKLDVTEPTIMAGFFVWLMGYRAIAPAWRGRPMPVWTTGALAVAAGLVTALGEATYFWAVNGVDPARLLTANLAFDLGLRPAWIVFLTGAALTAAAALRSSGFSQAVLRLRPT